MFSRTSLLASVAILLGFIGWLAMDRVHALRALPSGTGAWFVTYSKNLIFGFGPGGNETGFNVILLSEAGAERVAEGGISWLKSQRGGRLSGWLATPVPRDEFWMGRVDGTLPPSPDPTVVAILDRYGFGFDIPPKHRTALDAALNTPGSFYAFGRGGLVGVIVPATRRAYVFYAG